VSEGKKGKRQRLDEKRSVSGEGVKNKVNEDRENMFSAVPSQAPQPPLRPALQPPSEQAPLQVSAFGLGTAYLGTSEPRTHTPCDSEEKEGYEIGWEEI
jgi:hypothetical protein